jgi:predicted DNA-binding transcriptional regulator AlpA
MAANIPAILNLTALCRYLGVSRETAYQWLYAEQLPPAAKIINKRRYWTAEQIETFLEKSK